MTPEERAALQQIAMLRGQLMAQGLTQEQADAAIFGGNALTIGGGVGYLPYLTDLAGIQSSYNLGRGNLALSALDYLGRPYNVVGAQGFFGAGGGSSTLSGQTLGNVPGSSSGNSYLSFLDNLLYPQGGAMGTQEQRQASAAQALAPTVQGSPSATFRNTLQQGKVPGFSALNEREASNLTPDQFDQWMGLVGSTGQTSDPYRAYQSYLRTYGVPGTTFGGVVR